MRRERLATYGGGFKAIQFSLGHALLLLPDHGITLLALRLGALLAEAGKQLEVALCEVVIEAITLVERALPRVKSRDIWLCGVESLRGDIEPIHDGGLKSKGSEGRCD